MNQREIVLAALSAAEGQKLQPVQVQKLFFLIDKTIGTRVGGPHFDFRPYHYGPFDSGVYQVLNELAGMNLAIVSFGDTFQPRTYRLTPEGQAAGQRVLREKVDAASADYIRRACHFVMTTPFADLVSSIYKAYPEMRAKSIFRERQ